MNPKNALGWFLGMIALPIMSVAVMLGYVSRERLELYIAVALALLAVWVVSGGLIAPALHYMAACRTHPRARVERAAPMPAPRRIEREPRRAEPKPLPRTRVVV